MKKFIAATSLVLLLTISTATTAHAEDDPSIMQSGAPASQLEVTTDDGSSMRAQGNDVQPAGTGTSAAQDNTVAPDPAVQAYMAGESDGGQRLSSTEPAAENGPNLVITGGAIAVFAALAGGFYAIFRGGRK